MVIIDKIIVTDKFEKDVKKLRNRAINKRIDSEVKRLCENPEVGKPLGYTLKGERTIRINPYRLIYKKEGDSLILLRFEHRKEVYD